MSALVPDLASNCFVLLARAATEIVSIATLIVVSAPLGLVAALSIIVIISCHLGDARLVPRHFELLFRVLVTKAHNVSDFLFRVLFAVSSRFILSNCRLTFAVFARPRHSL